MEKVKNVEDAIALLKTLITMMDNGKEYIIDKTEPLDYAERLEFVKDRLEKVQELINNI